VLFDKGGEERVEEIQLHQVSRRTRRPMSIGEEVTREGIILLKKVNSEGKTEKMKDCPAWNRCKKSVVVSIKLSVSLPFYTYTQKRKGQIMREVQR